MGVMGFFIIESVMYGPLEMPDSTRPVERIGATSLSLRLVPGVEDAFASVNGSMQHASSEHYVGI